ncbi:alkylated DNA repair protein alkB homolog 8 isoform X2 [Phymastichus coffea]|uniref:alkylated DNA repair protein alkB homolog 8 isoform X2 n=1 Tax=Phymastichus coffea TaxID=108790 RepID=UPI00273A93CC|nr:alkylated DNA repair protein alkB homolog 8 isoform X2 [Phymastichus coffea]
MDKHISIKSIRKCVRKQKRAQHRLARDMDVECSETPTQYIAICNAGLVTGLQREALEQFIGNLVPNFSLTMPPEKSYSFVNFSNVCNAQDFYNKVHGIAQGPNQNTVFYLIFIKNIPSIEEPFGNELPPGLRLITDFISPEEESILLQSINWNEEDDVDSLLKNRKVKHFGYKFRYDNNLVDVDNPINPIPTSYKFLQSLFDKNDCGNIKYDQLTINRYLPGQGIPPHIDTHSVFEDPILSLSLGSAYVMDFKQGDQKVSLDLPARSLLIISGESRYAWSHGICPRHNDNVRTDNGFSTRSRATRVSFTFRKVHRGDCQCKYPEYCDSRRKKTFKVTPIDNSVASELENLYVHDVYEQISGHFNETRHKQWPNVTKFIEGVETGGLLLDVGCGNGKYLQGHTNVFKMGCDRSTGLAEICRSRGFQIIFADCLQLPYRSNVLDAVLCIAVIHHLSTNERRKQSICEIMRVLRPSGRALVYVWAKEQNKDSVKSTYLKFGASKTKKDDTSIKYDVQYRKTENNLTLPIHENRTEFTHSDMLVPWKRKGGGDFLRFYHVFEEGELEKLCSDVPSTKVQKVYYDQGNWCIVLEKTSVTEVDCK